MAALVGKAHGGFALAILSVDSGISADEARGAVNAARLRGVHEGGHTGAVGSVNIGASAQQLRDGGGLFALGGEHEGGHAVAIGSVDVCAAVKEHVKDYEGKGGGSAVMARAIFPDKRKMDAFLAELGAQKDLML